MQILSIVVVRGMGADTVLLNTDLPSTTWPFKGNLTLKFESAPNITEEYLDTYYHGIDVEIIDTNQIKGS